jgi:Family of unknown function (DUF6188)
VTVPSSAELFGGAELAAAGEVVSAITLDSNVVIHVGARREHEFRIENDFTVRDTNDGSEFVVRYDPYNRSRPVRENLTELSAIVATTVAHARAYVTGDLELMLSDQLIVTVKKKDKYEAWTYTFGNYVLACPPGGFATTS